MKKIIVTILALALVPTPALAGWLDGCGTKQEYLEKMRKQRCDYLGTTYKNDGIATKRYPDGSILYMWGCFTSGGVDVGKYWIYDRTTGEWCELRYMENYN